MQPISRYAEDLSQLAAEAAEVARVHCGACQNFHLIWPYLRLAGATGRAGDASPFSHPDLGNLVRDSRRILIAGCADTGLLALVARAASPDAAVTVLDRCETPLELCRRFAWRWQRQVETIRADLTERAPGGDFDLVLAHSLLQFIPADGRIAVLDRLRRTLAKGGRLALTFRTSSRIEGEILTVYRQSYPRRMVEQLEAMGVALPESQDAFLRRLNIYAEERRAREGELSSLGDVQALIVGAGFSVERLVSLEPNKGALFSGIAERIAKQRFLAIGVPAG